MSLGIAIDEKEMPRRKVIKVLFDEVDERQDELLWVADMQNPTSRRDHSAKLLP